MFAIGSKTNGADDIEAWARMSVNDPHPFTMNHSGDGDTRAMPKEQTSSVHLRANFFAIDHRDPFAMTTAKAGIVTAGTIQRSTRDFFVLAAFLVLARDLPS